MNKSLILYDLAVNAECSAVSAVEVARPGRGVEKGQRNRG